MSRLATEPWRRAASQLSEQGETRYAALANRSLNRIALAYRKKSKISPSATRCRDSRQKAGRRSSAWWRKIEDAFDAIWGIDDPAFVERMAAFVQAHSRVELLAYFNSKPGSLWDLASKPRSRAAYRRTITPLSR